MPDVIVIGAGLAGLAAARVAAAGGVDALVVEAADGVGGRVRTDEIDGFLLDRGFQVYLSAYPEGRRVLDLDALDLRPFEPGALVWVGGRFHRVADPFRRPGAAWASLRAPIGSVLDKLRVARMRWRLSRRDIDELIGGGSDVTTAEALAAEGFSAEMIDRFFRPLFAGITLDRDLAGSARVFRFVFRMLAEGAAAVPAAGMEQIPRQLSAGLGTGSVRLEARVASIAGTEVVLEGGERLSAPAVVVATDGPEAARLVGIDPVASRSISAVWYSAPEPPVPGPILLLDGEGDGTVNNVACLSEAAPSYAPPGRALVAVESFAEPFAGEAAVRRRLREWFGSVVDVWEHLHTHYVAHAQPRQVPPFPGILPVRIGEGRYIAGDHRATASIDGALRSGRMAGEAVVEDLRSSRL